MACGSCGTGKSGSSGGGCSGGCSNKLSVFNWLSNMQLPNGQKPFDVVEVRFKNSRKEFYRNHEDLSLGTGDVIATEAATGHDIGTVTMAGELVRLQLKKKNIPLDSPEIKKVYRKARQQDIDKWHSARELEDPTMFKARELSSRLGLNMKISDVEYQGDKTKAVFYYTADERVDFRDLIKQLAEEFKVRIEMRQIGARQEAGRLGGIGSCGRELCCSTWLTDFRSVSTSAARYQQLSLNPQKLAGQCGKLKCCLNYELDSYLDAIKDFPDSNTPLVSVKGKAYHQKTDIFKGVFYYAYPEERDNFIPVPVERVREIIALNKAGKNPDELIFIDKEAKQIIKAPDYENVVGQDSLTRFDKAKTKNKKKNKSRNKKKPEGVTGAAESTAIKTENKAEAQADVKPQARPFPRPERRQPRPPRNNPRPDNKPKE